MQHIPHNRTHHNRANTHKQTRPQLLQMLYKRSLLTMVQATRKPKPRHPNHPPYETGPAPRADPAEPPDGTDPSDTTPPDTGAGSSETSTRSTRSSTPPPDTESLNSRIPVPNDRPISGKRFAPKSRSKAITRRIRCNGVNSVVPMQPIVPEPPQPGCVIPGNQKPAGDRLTRPAPAHG
jgi:hypothetical protein